jgi:hypothetical protein
MRSWFWTNTKRLLIISGVISVVTHAGLIVAWVLATLPSSDVPGESIANHIFYIPPPDRVPTQGGTRETIHYVKEAAPGPGTGEGARIMGDARPVTLDETIGRPEKGRDSVTAPTVSATTGPDSLEVDIAAVRSTSSAAPAYPLKLLKDHIQGYVNAQYIVDTTGFADTTSFVVLEATHREFVTAVKEALPYMRFSPARIGTSKVRQSVQQQFSFKITDTNTVKAKKP